MTNEDQETFFIVPRYIMDLDGITLGYLNVYETIFQFWNKGEKCSLSERDFCERTNLKRSQIYEALNFFESHNELIRKNVNGKKYFIKPQQQPLPERRGKQREGILS